MDTPAFSLPSKHNLGQKLPRTRALQTSYTPPWSGCTAAESSRPCSGPMTAPTRCWAPDHVPSLSGLVTRRRSSPPAVSSHARTIRPSLKSYTLGPTAQGYRGGQAGRPPPQWSACHQVGLIFRPAGVHAFPATPGEVEYAPGNLFYPTLQGGFCTHRVPLLHSLHRPSTRNASKHHQPDKTSELASTDARARWDPCHTGCAYRLYTPPRAGNAHPNANTACLYILVYCSCVYVLND
jgi:hypothetical protein